MNADTAIFGVAAIILAIPCIAIGMVLAYLLWPLLLCWYLGSPAIGVLAEVVWLAITCR